MKAYSLFFLCSLFLSCRRLEGTKTFCGFDYFSIMPTKECSSSSTLKVDYHAGYMLSIAFNNQLEVVQFDTVIYMKDDFFLLDKKVTRDRLFNDTMVSITGKISDTVRTFVFGKEDGQYELFFVETPLSDSVINVEYVHKSDIIIENSFDKKLLNALVFFRQHVRFYDFAEEISFVYKGAFLYYTISDNYGSWKAIVDRDTIGNVFGTIYLDKYQIEAGNLMPGIVLHRFSEKEIDSSR